MIFKKRNFLFLLLSFALLAYGIFAFNTKIRPEFSIENVTFPQPYHREWETTPLVHQQKEQLTQILDQDFSYLGSGRQTYVFYSKDERYVLKLFRFHHLKASFLEEWLPPIAPMTQYKQHLIHSRQKRLTRIFSSHRLAFDLNKDNSGLIFIHLNNTSTIKKDLLVTDRFNQLHSINLDQTVFVIQEKAVRTRERFIELLDNGDVKAIKSHIKQLFDMYVSEYKRGIYDRDHNVIYNTGFIGDRAVHFDVGKMIRDESIKDPHIHKLDLEKIAWKRIDRWFRVYYPAYRSEVAKEMEYLLHEIFASHSDY